MSGSPQRGPSPPRPSLTPASPCCRVVPSCRTSAETPLKASYNFKDEMQTPYLASPPRTRQRPFLALAPAFSSGPPSLVPCSLLPAMSQGSLLFPSLSYPLPPGQHTPGFAAPLSISRSVSPPGRAPLCCYGTAPFPVTHVSAPCWTLKNSGPLSLSPLNSRGSTRPGVWPVLNRC